MARDIRADTDWVEDFLRAEQTDAELAKMRKVLREADRLRARTSIAPLTTSELVRAVRDEQDEN